MKLNNIFTKVIMLMVVLFTVTSCSEWLDINDDPNNAQEATPDQLLAAIQVSIGSHVGGRASAGGSINELPSVLVQHYYTLGTSRYSLDGASLNSVFRDIYADALRDTELLIAATAPAEGNLPAYSGIAKVQKAYLYSVLVDLFGDVPYSQASASLENLDPAFDDAQTIYNDLFSLLDEAIAELSQTTVEAGITPGDDLIYGGDRDAWVAFANSLKLKLYNQIRLVDPATATAGINGILNNPGANPIIDDSSLDFQFQYGSSFQPEDRHPLFQNNYINGTAHYMSNYMISEMLAKNDPRLPYYMYRQSLDDPTGTDVPCDAIPCFYGYQGSGYIGRDNGDPSGIPNDQGIRTVFGTYPAGGDYDDGSSNDAVDQTFGGQGAGIAPVLTHSILLFTQAEAALTLGTTGDPRALLQEAIEVQMDKVFDFSASIVASAPGSAAMTGARDAYVAAVLNDYDAATTNEERLQVIMTEKHFATFGNGMEAYNDYRRTGYPLFIDQNLQDGTTVTYPSNAASLSPLGPFPRLMPYANVELQTNANAPDQRLVAEPVFWDNN